MNSTRHKEAELIGMITHHAFYAGWPNAMSALTRARELLGKKQSDMERR